MRGMGGIGKTQLAYAVARRLANQFEAEVLVELDGTSDAPLSPDEAARSVVRKLGGAPTPLDNLRELQAQFRSLLADRRVLIVADNANDSRQVEALRPPAGSALIVTSRERIFLSGMTEADLVDLTPLSRPDAESLLLRTCPRIGTAASTISSLCGNQPLALEIGASLLANDPTVGVAEFVLRLKAEHTRLAALKRPGEPRSEVETVLSLSFARLDGHARSTLDQLTIFPASFTRDAAERVVLLDEAEPSTVAEALSLLYGRSLIEFSKETERYSLHDLTRVFVMANSEDNERWKVTGRHLFYFVAILAAVGELCREGGDLTLKALKKFDEERLNIEAGQHRAVERFRAGDTLFTQSVIVYGLCASSVLDLRLHPEEGLTWYAAALDASRQAVDRRCEGMALCNLGRVHLNIGEPSKAIECHLQHLAIARELHDRQEEGTALGNLGDVHKYYGEPSEAIEYHLQHLAIARELHDRQEEGTALCELGVAHNDLGEPSKAIEYHLQHLAITRELHDRQEEGNALGNLGLGYGCLGDAPKAMVCFEQTLAIAREFGDRRGEGNTLGHIGVGYQALGDLSKAIEYLQQSLAIAREFGDRRGEGITSYNLSRALCDLERTEEAIEYARRAIELFDEIQSPLAFQAMMLCEQLEESI